MLAYVVIAIAAFIAGAYVESKFSATINGIVGRIEAAAAKVEAAVAAIKAKL